jgi:uncharacterized membrane-anchored protein
MGRLNLTPAISTAFWLLLALHVSTSSALAQSPSKAPDEQSRNAEASAAWQAGDKAGTKGPANISLADQATVKLADGQFFIPKAEGTRIMRALGNTIYEPSFLGLIVGTKASDHWIVAARFIKEGYIKDDDAKDWNADDLLKNLKEGTDEANKDRLARGFPELEILGWVERPTYDAVPHQLVWSLLSKRKDEPDSNEKGINYNTYALGREGYLSLNLLTSSSRVAADKSVARTLLTALSYNSGKRYEDFNNATDHIAEYGLAALVGGVVAKKLGLLAVIGVFLLKFAKVIGIGALALGTGLWKFFRRKPEDA